MAYRGGYGSYRGRSRFRTFLKVLIVLLVAVLLLALAALFLLDRHIVYSADGIHIDLPFLHREEQTPDPLPGESTPVIVTTAPPATPTPEPEQPFHAVMLSREALYDGTAREKVQAAGANAAVFDMKADDGSLGYISALPLAIQAQVSASDPALNAAIRGLNEGELYTVARVSCFRDNAVPRADMSLAVKSSAGNWRDSGDYRWLSPMNEAARQYVAGVCAELAALGFDEILLDNCAFPTQGRLDYIKTGDSYDPQGLTQALEAFLDEVERALADWPEVKVSLVSTAAVLTGAESDRSGQTLPLLSRHAWRVWAPAAEDGADYASALAGAGMEAEVLVTLAGDNAAEADNWAILNTSE